MLEGKAVSFCVRLPICKLESHRTLSALKTDLIEDFHLAKRQVALYFIPRCLAVRASLHLVSRLFRQTLHDAIVAVDFLAPGTLRNTLDNKFFTEKATHVGRYGFLGPLLANYVLQGIGPVECETTPLLFDSHEWLNTLENLGRFCNWLPQTRLRIPLES